MANGQSPAPSTPVVECHGGVVEVKSVQCLFKDGGALSFHDLLGGLNG